jgi:hypothetical protein
MTLLSSAPYTNGHEPDRQPQGHDDDEVELA